jgi:hypothetical protein
VDEHTSRARRIQESVHVGRRFISELGLDAPNSEALLATLCPDAQNRI